MHAPFTTERNHIILARYTLQFSCCKLYALMAIGGQQILELLARVLLGVDGINRLILSLLLV